MDERANERARRCSLCGAAAVLVASDLPGFRAPLTFEVADCASCGTAFAAPMESDPGIYDIIYEQADRIAGYDRLGQLARGIQQSRAPLDYLAERGQTYWGVRAHLRERAPKRVLEIGSGLGYTTYAMRKAGYDATGIDLSERAVTAARARFGDFYRATTIEAMHAAGERFDTIVATELIEHVEDPVTFVRAALGLLTERGSLYLTTPNRAFSPPGAVWETDLPPVHLWWFREASFAWIARETICHVAFTDFSAFDARYPPLVGFVGVSEPTIGAGGEVIARGNPMALALRRAGLLHEGYRMTSRLAGMVGVRGRQTGAPRSSAILGAAFIRTPRSPDLR